MFRSVPCSHELSDYFGTAYPEFMICIQFEVEKRLPQVKYELYSYSTKEMVYYYGLRRYQVVKNEVNFCNMGPYRREEFLEGFKHLWNRINPFDGKDEMIIFAYEPFIADVLPFLQDVKMTFKLFPTMCYYMTEEQKKMLMTADPLPIPEGYELGSCSPKDAKLITDSWFHKGPGDEEQTKMKLASFPSSCLRYNGQPVGFEMVYPHGMLNHLFVMEEHRGKGLGHIVEQDLCRKLIREGHFVYKTVETWKTGITAGTEVSPYWTTVTDNDGSPKIMTYAKVIKSEREDSDKNNN